MKTIEIDAKLFKTRIGLLSLLFKEKDKQANNSGSNDILQFNFDNEILTIISETSNSFISTKIPITKTTENKQCFLSGESVERILKSIKEKTEIITISISENSIIVSTGKSKYSSVLKNQKEFSEITVEPEVMSECSYKDLRNSLEGTKHNKGKLSHTKSIILFDKQNIELQGYDGYGSTFVLSKIHAIHNMFSSKIESKSYCLPENVYKLVNKLNNKINSDNVKILINEKLIEIVIDNISIKSNLILLQKMPSFDVIKQRVFPICNFSVQVNRKEILDSVLSLNSFSDFEKADIFIEDSLLYLKAGRKNNDKLMIRNELIVKKDYPPFEIRTIIEKIKILELVFKHSKNEILTINFPTEEPHRFKYMLVSDGNSVFMIAGTNS